jgi:DNA polymerase I-like protein with 3'-5' exonuclease and polymerase domains
LFSSQTRNVIIVCDYSGQETVVAADLSGDAAMTKSVLEGADLHCLLARVLFPEIADLTDDEIVKGHKERNASKAPRFMSMEVMHLQYILMKEFH